MMQLILLAVDTIVIFVLLHVVGNLLDRQLEYADEQFKQGWRIQNLEHDKYELKARINALERQVNKNLDNDNVCD